MQKAPLHMTTQIIVIILIIGLAAGVLSGLVGVGGGIILVPALVYFLHYTQHQAQGTSLGVLTFPVVIIAFLNYYKDSKASGHPIEWKVIFLLAAGFIIGGFFGSKLALKIDQVLLKKIFAVILFYTAFKMLDWDKALLNLFK
jgi:uncharacterized protein